MDGSNGIQRSRFDQIASSSCRIFVGTWNVGGKSPDNNLNLTHWLKIHKASPHIYVLGFQEIVPLNAGNVLGPDDSGPAQKWLSSIHMALNGDLSDEPKRLSSSNELILLDDNLSSLRSWSSCSSSSEEEGLHSFDETSCSNCPSPISSHHHGDGSSRQHKYYLAASKQMVGIFICVWVREDLKQHITNTKVSCVGTGLLRYLGNKGSVSISMTVRQRTFCFVCTHLASGETQGDAMRRNLDVMEILKRTRFSKSFKTREKCPNTPADYILDHENIIWLGDLNYRLASICCDTYKLLERKDWQALLQKDELRIEQKADGGVFRGWEEGDIYFAPTYKYIANSDKYVVQKSTSFKDKCRRTPAWCDRILWKGEGIKQMCYERGESRFSDHRPVYSLFSVQMTPN